MRLTNKQPGNGSPPFHSQQPTSAGTTRHWALQRTSTALGSSLFLATAAAVGRTMGVDAEAVMAAAEARRDFILSNLE